MPSTKYGGSSGGSGDPFKNSTSTSMSRKLDKPKKKKSDPNREEEQSSRRRVQNRNSQRAYRERRERRLLDLEAQVQQAEQLNQTLTSAYHELRAEIDRIEAEKLQEQQHQYYGDASSSSAAHPPQSSSSSTAAAAFFDPAAGGYYATGGGAMDMDMTGSSSTAGGLQGGSAAWPGSSWDVNQQWGQGYDGYGQHGYGG